MKQPFYIAKLKKATLSKAGNITTIKVWLNQKDFIKDLKVNKHGFSTIPWIIKITARKNPSIKFLKKRLSLFAKTGNAEIATKIHPLRWLASGIILFLKTAKKETYIVLNKRPQRSLYGGFFDGFAGYSSSLTDMLHPDLLAIREFKEELAGLPYNKPEFLKIKNPAKIVIHYRKKTYTADNLKLFIDPDTATVDLRIAMQITINDIKKLKLKDQETAFVGPGKEVLQKRPIFIFPLDKIRKIRSKLTPAVKHTLNDLDF